MLLQPFGANVYTPIAISTPTSFKPFSQCLFLFFEWEADKQLIKTGNDIDQKVALPVYLQEQCSIHLRLHIIFLRRGIY